MINRSLRILFVTPCWPHDHTYGGQLRALHIGRALKQLGEVTLAVVSSDMVADDVIRKTAEEFRLEPAIHVESLPDRKLMGRLRRAFDLHYLNVHGCVANVEDRERLLRRFADFDLIWVLNSRTPNILNHWNWPRSVLDIDDVPSTFQRTIFQNGAGLGERLKAGATMYLLRRRERLLKERFTALAVCSEIDKQYLGAGENIHVIPNGFERPRQEPKREQVQPPRIGFIGLFSYLPNRSGIQWFLKECWPRIKREIPDVRLRLVGKDTDGVLKPVGQDIDALGWVLDPAEEIATWSAMIIPLRFGAGTRIKIADAFSRKCPVVSTRLGALGYEVQDNRELLLADSPDEFAARCVSLIRDPARAASLAERAYGAFLEKWTWDAIAPRVRATAGAVLHHAGRLSERESPAATAVTPTFQARTGEALVRDGSRAIKFSVIIPTYNRVKFVQLAIKSVMRQKCDGMEIIVVDDGSEDETASVLKKGDFDIKYIYQKNQGVSSARNRGIKEAVGEWVAFLDSDDEWHPDYLSRQQEMAKKYPSAITCVMDGEERGDSDNFIEKFFDSGMMLKFGSDHELLLTMPFQEVVQHHITTLVSCIMRRETLMKTRLFDEALSIGEDHDIIMQMALQGPFAFSRDIGAFRYRRKESIMNLSAQLYRSGVKARLSWDRVFDRFLQSDHLLESERKALCFRYSRNQRALGNLYLRVGDRAKAREAYKQAWELRPSIESAVRLTLSHLPFGVGKLFLHKEGKVLPGYVQAGNSRNGFNL